MIVLGLWGALGSGKSTAARLLRERHGFHELSFAGPLKALVGQLFDFDDATLHGPSEQRNAADLRAADPAYWRGVWARADEMGPLLRVIFHGRPGASPKLRLATVLMGLQRLGPDFTARAALQQIGTEWGRALWPEVWTEACRREVLASGAERVVLSDVRFPNEAQLVHSLGGIVVWIEAGERVASAAGSHASESRYADVATHCNLVLDNRGDVDALARAVDTLVCWTTGAGT